MVYQAFCVPSFSPSVLMVRLINPFKVDGVANREETGRYTHLSHSGNCKGFC